MILILAVLAISIGADAREIFLSHEQQLNYKAIFAGNGHWCEMPVRKFWDGEYGAAVRIETITCRNGIKQEIHYYKEEPSLACFTGENGVEGCASM